MGYVNFIREKVGHDCIFLNCVGCAILNSEGHVLLQKRSDRNTWGFPGGIMEIGESFKESVCREVFEETGLIIEVEKLLGVYSNYYDEYPNGDTSQPILLFFIGKKISGELSCEDEETLELKYFPLDNPPKLVNQQHKDMFEDLYLFNGEVFVR